MLSVQKRAWLNIGVGAGLSLVVLRIVGSVGPDFRRLMTWEEWRPTAHWIDVTCLVAAAIYFLGLWLTRANRNPGEVEVDERDQLISNKALKIQAVAVQIFLFIWMIVLTEAYIELGAIPIAIPFLIWLSSCLFAFVVHGIATLVWYRRMS